MATSDTMVCRCGVTVRTVDASRVTVIAPTGDTGGVTVWRQRPNGSHGSRETKRVPYDVTSRVTVTVCADCAWTMTRFAKRTDGARIIIESAHVTPGARYTGARTGFVGDRTATGVQRVDTMRPRPGYRDPVGPVDGFKRRPADIPAVSVRGGFIA